VSEKHVREEFDRWAEAGRGESMGRGHRDVTEQALDLATFTAEDRVLDVGCGVGWAVHLMLERGAGRGVGIDISPGMVARAASGAHFVTASATALPFADRAFSKILSVESIYYYGDLDGALREIRRVTAPGGRFLCVIDLYADNPGSQSWVEALEVPVHNLTAAQYRERFETAGFARAETVQIVDRRPVETEAEFEPSRWFPDYGSYKTYRDLGALLIDAHA